MLGIPYSVAGAGGPLRDLANALVGRDVYAVAFGAVLVVLTFVITRALHRSGEAEDLARRLGTSIDTTEFRREQNRALPPTLLFFAALYAANEALGRVPSLFVSLASLPLFAALAIDAVRAVRAPADHVGVWQERRAASIPVVRAVLEARGIETRVNGAATNVMLQSFGAYAPATILVPSADAERAAKILRHLLLGEEAPEAGADERDAPPAKKEMAPRTRLVALAAAFVAACGLFGVASMKPPAPAVKRPAKLEVVAVADDLDVFVQIPDDQVPKGFEIRVENVPLGNDDDGQRKTGRGHFASVALRKGESVEDAARRGDGWTNTLQHPPGMRIAWEPSYDWDDESGKLIPSGARTFVVDGDPVLTNRDIVEAMPAVDSKNGAPEVYIAITLANDAADRFGAFTSARVNRRLAILLDGRVNSAPVIRSAINGGRISITMGAYDFEKQMKEARALAAGLSQK